MKKPLDLFRRLTRAASIILLGATTFSPPAVAQDTAPPSAPSSTQDATGPAAQASPSARQLQAQAVSLTGQGKKREALAIYLRLASLHPESGVPALGRFLGLTDFEKERADFARSLEREDSGLDPLTRARGLLAVGEKQRALALLQNDPAVRTGRVVRGTLLLATLLNNEDRTGEAEQVLFHALTQTPLPEDRVELMKALFSQGRPALADTPASFTLALDLGTEAWLPDADEFVRLADPLIIAFQHSPDYFKRRDGLMAWADRRGPATACFLARMTSREERREEALKFLRPIEEKHRNAPLWPLVAEQMAELCRGLGRHGESQAILETLARQIKGRQASVLALKAAGAALAQRDNDKALKLLAQVQPDQLNEDELRVYYANSFAAAAKARNIPRILDLYAEAMPKASQDDFELVHMILFDILQETEEHRELDKAIRKKMEENPNASPFLWRLDAETCVRLRSKPNQLEALYRFVQARPKDLTAIELLARAAVPLAVEVVKAPKDSLAVPQDEIAKLATITEQSLIALIKSRPYDPTYYGALMSLYKSMGKKQREILAVADVVTSQTANPRLIAVAAYALATNEYPQQAIGYYDRALALDPHDMDIRMNRAGCLTRLDRWDEAAAFYRELLENGQYGRSYHVHELVERLWRIHRHQKTEKEAIEYLRSLESRIQGPWIDEALRDVASLMAAEKRLDVAEEFCHKLQARAKTDAEKADLEMVLGAMYGKAENHAKAEAVYRAAAERFKADPERHVDFQQARAEALMKLAKTDESIQLLRDLARNHPDLPAALSGLFAAARIAEETGKTDLARVLYREYLKTPTTEFGRRRQAEERLLELESAAASKPKPAAKAD